MYNNQLEDLIKSISKLPGLGKRSAQRAVLQLLKNKETQFAPLMRSMQQVYENTKMCEVCGNMDMLSPCHICVDEKRDRSSICVVEEVADLWALERNAIFNGTYHVLGGTLSAIDGMGPEDLRIPHLLKRIQDEGVQEVIIATNATVDGQTTAHYIAEKINALGVKVTRLAHGIPVGGELDYLDEGTLLAALRARALID